MKKYAFLKKLVHSAFEYKIANMNKNATTYSCKK